MRHIHLKELEFLNTKTALESLARGESQCVQCGFDLEISREMPTYETQMNRLLIINESESYVVALTQFYQSPATNRWIFTLKPLTYHKEFN